MITFKEWDSKLFKKKIGEINLALLSEQDIITAVASARENGYDYIYWKISEEELWRTGLLESYGFYLSDIGVTFMMDIESSSNSLDNKKVHDWQFEVRSAVDDDIDMLKEMATDVFVKSRFYSDPFYSPEKANLLFQFWIENAVRGAVADIVLLIDRKGFITGRLLDQSSAEIGLFSVSEDSRHKGVGTLLVMKIADYFRNLSANTITVRTQLRNIDAMNFYSRLGFTFRGYDLIFSMIL